MHHKDIDMRWALILSLLWMAFCAAPGAQQPRPVGQPPIEIFVDRGTESEPTDLSGRFSQVDAAIRGRVVLSEVKAVPRRPDLRNGEAPIRSAETGDIPYITTENVITVLEVFKSHPQMPTVNSVIRVSQLLGTTTWNGRTVIRHDGRANGLEPNAEYVLLLKWSSNGTQFILQPNDIFRISSGQVETPATAAYARAHAGMSTQDFLVRIRGLRGPI
jgi:hypothetical protein